MRAMRQPPEKTLAKTPRKPSDALRAERRRQILEAAWVCFQRQGIHATAMSEIIGESGLSAGAVYAYFSGKEELIAAAVTTSLAGLKERLAPILEAEPAPAPEILVAQIAEAVTSFTDRKRYDLRRVALLGWAEAQRDERLRATMQGFYLEFRNALARAATQWKARGDIGPKAGEEDVARALLSSVLGLVVQSAILGDVTPAEFARGMAHLTRRDEG